MPILKIVSALSTFFLLAITSAIAQEAPKVVYYSARQIEADIRNAKPNSMGESEINLIERTPGHAGILLRRTEPGKAEVHEHQADVWYVIDGGCTFVTGGTVVNGAPESRGEIRGSAIEGGEEHQLGKGDFVRVAAGVPHWVKQIQGKEIVYIVVKYAEE